MGDDQAYITLMGRSGWAVVNSFHAVSIETEYRPVQIHLIHESQYSDAVEPVVQGLEAIQSSYTTPSVSCIEVPDWDAHAAGRTALELVQTLREKGFEVALDITGGRKALVTGSLLALREEPFRHVYYLAIETTEGAAKPYLMIPKRIQRLFDIVANEVQSEKTSLEPKNADTDLRLSRDCMMILLNQAYTRGEKIAVKAPLVGVDILELDLQEQKVVMKTDRSDYQKKSRAQEYEGSDHPSYSDLRRCMCYCGILEYENESEFLDLLSNDLSRTFDPNSRVRRSFLSLDSNMFYNGFPSKLEILEDRLKIPPKDVLCVTPNAVRTEVQKGIRRKYRKDAIRDAKNHYKSAYLGGLLDEFVGQNMLTTRMAKMARSQLSKFMSRASHMMAGDDEELPQDSEAVDPLIVGSLKRFAREHRVRVALVSADKNMYDFCDLVEDVYPLILRPPHDIPRTMAASDQIFADLLVGLSLLYGIIELEGIGLLFGEYRGKQSEVYMNEVKIRVHNLHRARILQERVGTCSKLKELNIDA
ncbi:MAG: hypothetical protein ACE5H4_15575 [Candidatus Thorarchaeota archaeon]